MYCPGERCGFFSNSASNSSELSSSSKTPIDCVRRVREYAFVKTGVGLRGAHLFLVDVRAPDGHGDGVHGNVHHHDVEKLQRRRNVRERHCRETCRSHGEGLQESIDDTLHKVIHVSGREEMVRW